MSKYIFLAGMLILLAVGCRKSNSIVGRVYNAYTGEGVENIEVVLHRNVTARNPEGKPVFFYTNYLGDFFIDMNLNPNRGHRLEIRGIYPDQYYLLNPYEVAIADKQRSRRIDLAFVELQNVILHLNDTTKAMPSEQRLLAQFSHPVAEGYFPDSTRELRNNNFNSFPTIRLPQGWNYIKGYSYRSGQNDPYLFTDSFFVDINSSNPPKWILNY